MIFPDNKKRTYQCFVCAVTFKTYEEMKNHVFESHEIGREYLVCPVKHCGAPVRDLRFHFKTRHPACSCPKDCQLRATVMYDISSPNKRKKLPNFKEGYLISEKNHGKKMHYRSSYEEDIYLCLERMGDVLGYEVEPFPITYYYKGKKRQYYPDLRITYTNGTVQVAEIKPANQTVLDQNQAKFKAARQFCQQRGWQFEIFTEQRIRQLKKNL